MEKIHADVGTAGHYTPGIISNGLLYISGQVSIDPATGKIAPGGIKAETLMALQRVEKVLHAAGVSKEAVVSCRIYMTDSAMWGDINEVYAEFFGEHKPTRAAIPIGKLRNGCNIEIEAVAEMPANRKR